MSLQMASDSEMAQCRRKRNPIPAAAAPTMIHSSCFVASTFTNRCSSNTPSPPETASTPISPFTSSSFQFSMGLAPKRLDDHRSAKRHRRITREHLERLRQRRRSRLQEENSNLHSAAAVSGGDIPAQQAQQAHPEQPSAGFVHTTPEQSVWAAAPSIVSGGLLGSQHHQGDDLRRIVRARRPNQHAQNRNVYATAAAAAATESPAHPYQPTGFHHTPQASVSSVPSAVTGIVSAGVGSSQGLRRIIRARRPSPPIQVTFDCCSINGSRERKDSDKEEEQAAGSFPEKLQTYWTKTGFISYDNCRDCPICFCPMVDVGKLVFCKKECGTNFHKECIRQWSKTKKRGPTTCPTCRQPWL